MRKTKAVFARLLNTSLSTVQKWEIGQKKPTGTALKLLHPIQKFEFIKSPFRRRRLSSPANARRAQRQRDLQAGDAGIAPPMRQRPMRSLSSQAPMIAAKITEVSRSAATAGIDATVIAHNTIA